MQNRRASQSQYPGASPPSKVAIPRLERRDDPNPAASERHRVIKAASSLFCTNCRKRKVKCTGEAPRCKNCEGTGTLCIYEQARKDRLKTTTQQKHVFISLLKDLSLRVGDDDKKTIDDILEGVGLHNFKLTIVTDTPKVEDEVVVRTPSSVKTSRKRARKDSISGEDVVADPKALGEAKAPASVGSNEDMDLLDEDLLRNRASRETGFVGQNSEVQWLRSLQRQMGSAEDEPSGQPYGPPGTSNGAMIKRINAMHERRKASKSGNIRHVADSGYFLDIESLEVETMLDPYELPPPEIAERLFSCYVETVHGWFPIIPETWQ